MSGYSQCGCCKGLLVSNTLYQEKCKLCRTHLCDKCFSSPKTQTAYGPGADGSELICFLCPECSQKYQLVTNFYFPLDGGAMQTRATVIEITAGAQ